jgi:hypothetical protein
VASAKIGEEGMTKRTPYSLRRFFRKEFNMGLFSRSPSIEQQLKEVYVPMLMQSGMPISQANEVFSVWLSQAKEESKKENSDNLPQNFGDLLLQKEATVPNIKSKLAKLRREGVTDDDVRTWWNLPDLDRRVRIKYDENSIMAVVIDQLDKMGATKETMDESMDKAEAHARKYFPVWGDPDNYTKLFSGDDRPLPAELKFRINLWLQMRQADPNFKEELERSTTFNALVRREIAKGNL